MRPAYYNEFDPAAAAWLRELIKQGHIAPGEVDERSIEDVKPADLAGFGQCHFFAGIGGWSLALRMAGWPDDRPVWTGSCPCQPFSAAGKGTGFADPRHLWPHFYRLIRERCPAVVFGEQVASADGLQWLDLVCADLEASRYAVGAADLCAAGVGAPRIRQRLYWVAHRSSARLEGCDEGPLGHQRSPTERGRSAGRMAHAESGRHGEYERDSGTVGSPRGDDESQEPKARGAAQAAWHRGEVVRPGPTNGHWRAADWLGCRDGKWRPVEPGTFPLAHGLSRNVVRGSDPGAPIDAAQSAEGRVMRLCGYGNAIVPWVAATFIRAAA